MKLKFLAIIIILIGILAIAAAEIRPGAGEAFTLSKYSYSPGEVLQGTINISIINEPTNTLIRTDLLNESTKLIDFIDLELEKEVDYFCTPADCKDFYDIKGSNVYSKTILSNSLIGPMIVGRNIQIKQTALKFNITPQDTTSTFTKSPVKIDLLNDGTIDWMYLQASNEFGSELFSPCYNITNFSKAYDIDSRGLCQKIDLIESSKFRINAVVKKVSDYPGNLWGFIYDSTNQLISDDCDLAEPISSSYMTLSCDVDFTVIDETADYYACIKDTESDSSYRLRGGLGDKKTCPEGHSGLPTGSASADFAISVNPAKIAAFSKTVVFNADEFEKSTGFSLMEYLQNYILDSYNGDCIKNKCVIPINITTKLPLTINNLEIGYCEGSSLCQSESYLYDIYLNKAKIKTISKNANYTLLNLESAKLHAPETFGNYSFRVYFGSSSFLTNLTVEKVPVITGLATKVYPAATTTTIVVFVSSPNNLSLKSFEWDFGDGQTVTTDKNSVSHVFATTGTYELSVKVSDSEGKSAKKIFDIIVGSPKEMIATSISQKNQAIDRFSSTLAGYSSLEQDAIKEAANINLLKKIIEGIQGNFTISNTEDEYISLMASLNELSIPVSTSIYTNIPEFEYPVDPDKIDLTVIETAGAGSFDEEKIDLLRNTIAGWDSKFLNIMLSSKIISITNDASSSDFVTIINLVIEPKTQTDLNETYLIINSDYSSTKFASDYNQKDLSEAVGIILQSGTGSVSFSLPGQIEISDFVLYLSPKFEDLNAEEGAICNVNGKCESFLGENTTNCRQDCKPIKTGVFLFILLIVFLFIAYFFLSWWYEAKYESYLFKNRQDLANITLFISNALNRGVSEKEIREKLKKAGWTGEQIEYTLNKVKGIKMGMPSLRAGIKKKQKERLAKNK